MMKKKLVVLLLVASMVMITLAGCGSTSSSDDSSDVTKVGFIYVGPADDGGWTEVHDNGRAAMEEYFDGQVETFTKENVSEEKSDVLAACDEMVDQGCSIIFATSFGFMDGVVEAAEKYPDVKFEHATGYETADNLGTYFGRMYEARYLAGIVAGMTTTTNEIAYVAAFPIPEVVRGIDAFALGVKSVNPDAKINVSWTKTWYDPATEKAAAEALINQGCDVTAQHQDSTATMEAAKEAGILSIGYDLSAADAMPDVYMTAPVFDFSQYYIDAVQSVIDGTWTNEQYWGHMSEGIVSLDALTDNVPNKDEVQAEVDTATEAINDGSLFVFSGEIKDQTGTVKVADGEEMSDADMLSLDWFVDNVVGTIQ